jgi:hypothetical protein
MMMRGMASLGGVKPLQVFMVNGQPMALVECSGASQTLCFSPPGRF